MSSCLYPQYHWWWNFFFCVFIEFYLEEKSLHRLKLVFKKYHFILTVLRQLYRLCSCNLPDIISLFVQLTKDSEALRAQVKSLLGELQERQTCLERCEGEKKQLDEM